eukprot:CAMPEP_0206204356 /NCGR_PEP_ID=MMETSP0166-20121206/13461_1 /ASSEMBLY_ACC=CAM_ASM_000260 /TAXON_ID=95228 /ORGANISM="Vannella robusta, Strain DIVA3 518/3/11/1/6" /LENGTH=160 /DNA_ID=CAMNT_0053623939 /DNA_START=176 /DNA_END=658 /DNA_ORIENTATION=+
MENEHIPDIPPLDIEHKPSENQQSPRATAAPISPRKSAPSTVPLEWKPKKPRNGRMRYKDPATGEVHLAPPPGWSTRKNHDGRLFYIHHATETSHWFLPPPGIDIGKTTEGKIYYINNKHEDTQWAPPPPPSPGPLPTRQTVIKHKRPHLRKPVLIQATN